MPVNKIIWHTSILVVAFSCAVNKNLMVNKTSTGTMTTGQDSVQMFSAATKAFIDEYHNFIASGKQGPGQEMIDKYGLREINGNYYIGLLMEISPELDMNRLKALAAIMGSRTPRSLSLKIPVQNIEKLRDIKGILYADINKKVSTR